LSPKSAPAVAGLSPLRYSHSHESVLAFERNRVLIDLAAQGKRVLELGCADGFISRHLVERGCRVVGVEISSEAAGLARQWCKKVVVHDLNDRRWMDQAGCDFDTVLCGDVLEHLVNPLQTLREIARLLTPDGRVVMCLPNVAHIRVRMNLLVGKFDYTPTGILDSTHLRFFTQKTARRLIEEAGYQLISFVPIVGGGLLTRPLRLFFPNLFAVQMIYAAKRT